MNLRILGITGLVIVALLILFGLAVWLYPEWLIGRLRKRSPEVLYSVETKDLVVALTIDDGPDAVTSPQILDLLAKHQAHATFFLITDHINGNEEIVRRMVSEGHELGNHLTEDKPSIALNGKTFEQSLLAADDILTQYAEVVWMRPGSGWYSETMLATVQAHGYQMALGSIYPYDPQISLTWYSANYVLWKLNPGAVIILHDNNNRGRRTVKALETILPALAARGYRVVTLSELVELGE